MIWSGRRQEPATHTSGKLVTDRTHTRNPQRVFGRISPGKLSGPGTADTAPDLTGTCKEVPIMAEPSDPPSIREARLRITAALRLLDAHGDHPGYASAAAELLRQAAAWAEG